MNTLVIVESPTKAREITKFLGAGYTVIASKGHIRDLPDGREGIGRSDNDTRFFDNKYEVYKDHERTVQDIVAAAKKADEILLASDPDREGEAISWHVDQVLRERLGAKAYAAKRVLRVSYNEITRRAVLAAVANARETGRTIDMDLVNAQQCRRFLDRFIGWRVSRVVARNLPGKGDKAAGRVQSVVLRMVCEREDEIAAFRSKAYWEYAVSLRKTEEGAEPFTVRLRTLDGQKAEVTDEETNRRVVDFLTNASYAVDSLETARKERNPGAPFITSTLQQAAHSALHLSSGQTMRTAQALFENGFITYMRTDHPEVSREAQGMAAAYIRDHYGADHSQPRSYRRNRPGEQGAHEGIRPTDVNVHADAIPDSLGPAARRLYDLIWKRFVTSQMKPAVYSVGTLHVTADSGLRTSDSGLGTSDFRTASLTASVATLVFDGFLVATPERKKEAFSPDAKPGNPDKGGREETSDALASLPPVAAGETLACDKVLPERKETKPPAHYNEASLVRAMEKEGIGRPSTYASTLESLRNHKYLVERTAGHVLAPTDLGRSVVDFLVRGDARAPKGDALFYTGYTRQMESLLDAIAHEESGSPDPEEEESEVRSPESEVRSPKSEVQGPKSEVVDQGVAGAVLSAPASADWQRVLANFYQRLKEWLGGIKVTGPADLFRAVLEKFREVREWAPPRQEGKRTYDDRKFVQEIACDYMGEERPHGKAAASALYRFDPANGPAEGFLGSVGQLRYLLRILVSYRDQLPGLDDFGARLRAMVPADLPDAAEILESIDKVFQTGEAPAADPAVDAAIGLLEQHGVLDNDATFFASLRDQARRGKALSPKQKPFLWRMFHAAGQAGRIPGYGPELCTATGIPWMEIESVDPERVKDIVEALAKVASWEPAATRRGRTYDDKAFYEDVAKGWRERGRMFPKALAALEKMLARYKDQVPEAPALMERYGIAEAKARPARAARSSAKSQTAETAGAAAAGISDADRAKVEAILGAFDGFTAWQPARKWRGRTYDDSKFIPSIAAQLKAKGSLSDKQIAGLEKTLVRYKDSLPSAAELMARLGIAGE